MTARTRSHRVDGDTKTPRRRAPAKSTRAATAEAMTHEISMQGATAEAEPSTAIEVPVNLYDDGLLDRCREQWRRGDWQELEAVSVDDIERHPNRQRIALLVAAAHQARGQHAQTRLFVRLARQWGCPPRLVARVLIAGVHNTLGRAAAAGGKHRERAMHHFGEAVAPGTAGASRWLATQVRVRHQLEQLQLGAEATALLAGSSAPRLGPPAVVTPFRELNDGLRKHGETFMSKMKEQVDQLAAVRRTLETTIKGEVANAVKQLEAFANLQNYMANGELTPELHGWPVSPDFALLLVRTLKSGAFDAVIEFGSGSSTVLLARTLAKEDGPDTSRAPRYLALEHLEPYHAETLRLLQGAAVGHLVDVALAPLVPTTFGDQVFPYYDCVPALNRLAQRMADVPEPKLLVIVDGPPATTGRWARYPALEVVLAAFPKAHGVVILDDYARSDEKEIAQQWLQHLEKHAYRAELVEHALEKQACSITFGRPAVTRCDH